MGVLIADGAEVLVGGLTDHVVQVLCQVVDVLLLVSWEGEITCFR